MAGECEGSANVGDHLMEDAVDGVEVHDDSSDESGNDDDASEEHDGSSDESDLGKRKRTSKEGGTAQ